VKITNIATHFVDRYLFVTVHTDSGLVGLGESGAWGFLEASAQAVETFKRYLIGEDPLKIEHHWQYLYRWTHFRGAAIMGALSAIDIALWDIAGKHFDAPSISSWADRPVIGHVSTITSLERPGNSWSKASSMPRSRDLPPLATSRHSWMRREIARRPVPTST